MNKMDLQEKRELRAVKDSVEEGVMKYYKYPYLDADAVVGELLDNHQQKERIDFVLANTIVFKKHDGRFSGNNRQWAEGVLGTNEAIFDYDLIVSDSKVHSALLDGVVTTYRKKVGK